MELGLSLIIQGKNSKYFVHKAQDFELQNRTNRRTQTWTTRKFVPKQLITQGHSIHFQKFCTLPADPLAFKKNPKSLRSKKSLQ